MARRQFVVFADVDIQCLSFTAKGRHYSCTVWHEGRRVTAYARTPLMAAESALKKLKEPKRRTPKAKQTTLKVSM